jgi:hypothetical protein
MQTAGKKAPARPAANGPDSYVGSVLLSPEQAEKLGARPLPPEVRLWSFNEGRLALYRSGAGAPEDALVLELRVLVRNVAPVTIHVGCGGAIEAGRCNKCLAVVR